MEKNMEITFCGSGLDFRVCVVMLGRECAFEAIISNDPETRVSIHPTIPRQPPARHKRHKTFPKNAITSC